MIDHALSEQDRRHSALLEIFLKRFSSLSGLSILHRRAATDLRSGGYGGTGERAVGSLLEATDVEIRSSARRLCAVDSLLIDRGTITLIVGDNGAGKSLLCRFLIGELPTGLSSRANVRWANGARPSQAYVNQDVTLGFSHGSTREELLSVAAASLDQFRRVPGFSESDLDLSPFELTMDKQKLLAVLKAIGQHKEMVVLDEPSEYWDAPQAAFMVNLLARFAQEGGSVLIATHDGRLLETSYPRICLVQEKALPPFRRSLHGLSAPRTSTPSVGRDYMYNAWEALHEKWPNSTLELFENWHENVDDLLRLQIVRLANGRSRANLLDLGCGNGLQTLWLRSQLILSGISVGQTLGIDWQQHAIEWATSWAEGIPEAKFIADDIDIVLGAEDILAKFDVISTLFVLHDLPHASNHITQVFSALAPGGAYLSCLLNPEWIDQRLASLLGKEDLPVPNDADFAREYLLPESPAGSLGLPYFHRSIERYKKAFALAGFERVEVAFSKAPARGSDDSQPTPQTLSFLAFKPADASLALA